MQTLKIGKYRVSITHASRELFPKDHITKEDVIQYYLDVAEFMLPHIKNRLITMQRFPNGIRDEGFFQKNIGGYFPAWIKSVPVKKKGGGVVHYAVCNDAATLIYLANQLCLTPHVWLSKKDKLNYPDRMIFDLDPSKKDFALVKQTAFLLKDILETIGLVPYVMITGSRGIHVVVPLKRRHTFEEVRDFAYDIASHLVREYPRMMTLEMRKAKRRGRVFLDTLRNGYGATAVAPYAIRPKPGAPVATPITWRELSSPTMHAQRYTIKTVLQRLARKDDPWRNMSKDSQSLVRARKKLNALLI